VSTTQIVSQGFVQELLGTECRCGRQKRAKQTFCLRCYRQLSADQRHALYRRIGAGYEEAYLEALKVLADRRMA